MLRSVPFIFSPVSPAFEYRQSGLRKATGISCAFGSCKILYKKKMQNSLQQGIAPITGNFTAEKEYFEYGGEGSKFLVLYGAVSEQQPCVTYLYLYSLKPFLQNVKMQRIGFFAVWLFSIPLVYLFSYGFTSHALQPVAQNHEKQKEFIAFASHELRSPLAVLKTGLSMLEHKPNSGKRERIFSLMGKHV